MSILLKYLAISWITIKNNLAYAAEVGGRLFFLGVILFIFMQLWKATYSHAGATTFGGFSLREIIWYLTLTEAIMMSVPRLSARIDEDVRTGVICVQLVKPMSYPMYWLFTDLGERLVRFTVTIAAGAVMAWCLAGPLVDPLVKVGFALLALPLAFILDFLGYFLVGLCAFWLEDTYGLTLIYSRLTMVLGGMLIPLQLLPNWLSHALRELPFASIVYAPAQMFVHPNSQLLVQLLIHQIFWVAVFAAAVWLVYGRALNRIAANGG
jgi:ABC-2 type transport system permease protein